MENLDLTETIRLDTGIKFPHPPIVDGAQIDTSVARGETIVAEICSEFTEYRAQVEYFKKNGLVRLAHDKDALPIAFSLSEDAALCALRHGTHAGEGWLSFDISPVGQIVTTFDVAQVGDLLYIAAACKATKDAATHSLFCCTVDVSEEGFHLEHEAVAQKGGMQWIEIPDNAVPKDRVGATSITSLLCKVVGDESNENKSFQITVSTAQHGKTIATIYNVQTVGLDGRHWTKSSFPVAASLLVQTEPLILGQQFGVREEGLVSVVKGTAVSGKQRCIGQRCAPNGGFYSSFEYKTGVLGDVRSAFSHLNIFGFTDVFFASENGIGFFSWETVDMMTIEEPILKGVGFKQLVVSEAEDLTREGQSKLAIFAVSDDDCLYFIEGTRDYSEVKLKYTFEASGFPIRKGVTHLAARFNAPHGTNELLYASSEDNALFFLRRTPAGNSWVEDKITRRALRHIKYDAFVTSIVLTDGHGSALPSRQDVSITADSLHAVANGKAYTFSNQPVSVAPDTTGCVLVAIPSASKLGCSPFHVSIGGYTFSVDPAQRVSRLLSSYDSSDKLRDAKSTSGKPLLGDMSSEQLTEAASLLGQYKTAKLNIDNPSSVQQDSKEGDSWFDKAVDGVEKFLGDAIEMIKNVVKTGVKIFVRVFGPVIKIVLMVAGKIIKWVCKGVYALLEVIGSGLELIFGYDGLSKFLEALKLAVDPKQIAKTQKFLSDVITQGLQVASKIIIATKDSVMDAMHDGGEFIKGHIDDPRVPAKKFNIPWWIKKIFDNPFTRLLSKINPLSWVLEALYEEMPDLKLPDISPLLDKFSAVFTDALEGTGSILQQLWETLFSQLQVVSADPAKIVEAVLNSLKSVFWTFWDTAALIVEKTFDSLAVFLDELGPLLSEEWNIPGLTDSWEDLTEQKFSLLGFLTFVPAAIINLSCAVSDSYLPEFGPVDMSSIEIEPFYKKGALQTSGKKVANEDGHGASIMSNPMFSAMSVSTAKTLPLDVLHNTLFMRKQPAINSAVAPGTLHAFAAATSTKPASDEKNKGDTTNDDDEWTMPHWYELVFEDLGKTYSGLWNTWDSCVTALADSRAYNNPQQGQPPAVEPNPTQPVAPEGKRPKRWWVLFRHLGKGLQGCALVYSAAVTARNTIVIGSKHTVAKGTVAVLGGIEVIFFVLSLVVPSRQEGLGTLADIVGSGGTALRCIDDGEWDGEAISESAGSTAVVVGIVTDWFKQRDVEPVTKVCLAAAGVVCAGGDLGCSAYGLYRAKDEQLSPRQFIGVAIACLGESDLGGGDKNNLTKVLADLDAYAKANDEALKKWEDKRPARQKAAEERRKKKREEGLEGKAK
ncbi:hypothetical protein B0H63DRAFT_564578 [Podospora didyma]|uniref:Uncharacterized protein n=1 Tax=Podospora didyma TaxID=330526 RepID=A0AAE0N4F1_9PEZI|nr:hypothetical protein B0H63DRAFT_564578 [Podospora didyma]